MYIHPILVLTNSEKSPSIPLAYFFHEKKFEKTHNEFWRYISEVLPEISNAGFFVTDCEDAFRNSIKQYFPKTPHLRCLNHFWKSVERWILGNKKLTNDDVGVYCESLRELLLQPTQQLFEVQLEKKINGYTNSSGNNIPVWKTEFVNYYDSNIAKDIEGLAAYSVKPFAKSQFKNFTGITTNHSEGLNNLLKLINERNETPLDVIVLSLHQLSIYYSNEVKYGFGNRGNYRLNPEFKELCFLDTRYINTREALEPSQIIKSLISDKDELLKMCGVQFTPINTSEESSSEVDSNVDEVRLDEVVDEIIVDFGINKVAETTEDLNVILNSIVDLELNEDNSQKTLTQSSKNGTSNLNVSSDGTSSDGEEFEQQPFELKTRYNSKIARAL
ncbi:unnamed protein product [Brachionus calyciflorus]|uniref:MULE transposase domain-containing protein n=1 Tax=Brachionus calyciflorus TaxID=104777 RepID=A0A813LWP5_9BILA|nr:unnamed protein product [Brachionus calyciflorus]